MIDCQRSNLAVCSGILQSQCLVVNSQQLLSTISMQISNFGLQLVGKQCKSASVKIEILPIKQLLGGLHFYKKGFDRPPVEKPDFFCTFIAVGESGRVQNKEFTCGKCDRV